MSLGAVLAEARRQAGLTVSEVSQQTRIRESIIRGIEQDDYAACGGDFYARGHIRAMARAVGTDPVPLIDEYDAAQAPPSPEGPPFPERPADSLQEPDEPGTAGGWRGEPPYRPGGVPPPPAELGLPYQPGGFRPLPADPGPHRDPEPGPSTLRPPIPPYDTGNVRPLPADPGPAEDNGDAPQSLAGRSTARDPGPGGASRTPPSPPAGSAPTVYSFTDSSVAPDPGPADPGPARPSSPTRTAPTVYSFSDPSATLDPEPDHSTPAPPSPPTGSTPTVYSFTDPSAPSDAFADPGVAPDTGPEHRVFTDPDAEPGPGRRVFSDFGDLDGDDLPGGRFFSEPDAPDDVEPESAAAEDWRQQEWTEPGAGQQQWDDTAVGQQQGDDAGTGQQEWDGTGQQQWDETGPDQHEWTEAGASQQEWGDTGRQDWDESGAGQSGLTGLDALFGPGDAQPPPGGAATEPRGYPEGPAAGSRPAHPAPGGQPAAPPPTRPPPRPPTRPGTPRGAGPAPAAGRTGGRQRRPNRTAIILIGLLVVIGVLSYVLLSGSGGAPRPRPAAAPSTHASASHRPSPTPTPSSPSPASTPTRTLHPVRAAAFGPAGGHGDNPQEAALAIDGRRGTAWGTDWYNTSHFGNLQNGTGLLLNMGRRVTVSAVSINLGRAHRGVGLRLRAGSAATPGGLRTVARASGAGARGIVRLRLSSPAHARYLLIWFTTLPRDAAGTYQAKIYNVMVRGTG